MFVFYHLARPCKFIKTKLIQIHKLTRWKGISYDSYLRLQRKTYQRTLWAGFQGLQRMNQYETSEYIVNSKRTMIHVLSKISMWGVERGLVMPYLTRNYEQDTPLLNHVCLIWVTFVHFTAPAPSLFSLIHDIWWAKLANICAALETMGPMPGPFIAECVIEQESKKLARSTFADCWSLSKKRRCNQKHYTTSQR